MKKRKYTPAVSPYAHPPKKEKHVLSTSFLVNSISYIILRMCIACSAWLTPCKITNVYSFLHIFL